MKSLSIEEIESVAGAGWECVGGFALAGGIIGGVVGGFTTVGFGAAAGIEGGGLIGGLVGEWAC